MPAPELPVLAAHGELVPDWLTLRDVPLLRGLCDAAAALVGVPWRQARQRLLRLGDDARGGRRLPFAARVLAQALPTAASPFADAARLRLLLAAARRECADAAAARAQVGSRLGLSPAALQQALLADLRGERLLRTAPPWSPSALQLQANLVLAGRLLRRAAAADLQLCGRARGVVRQLRLGGVGCEVRGGDPAALVRIGLLPPPAPQQRRFGRALASLLPLLPWCERFRLRASVDTGSARGTLVLQSGDPLPAGREPRPYDSRVERRFAAEFAALQAPWRLLREPAPLPVAGTLQFPDFAAVRSDHCTVLLEIAAFWRPDYLQRKLQLLGRGLPPLLLCVDARWLPEVALPAAVLPFRGRLDAAAVLRRLEAMAR